LFRKPVTERKTAMKRSMPVLYLPAVLVLCLAATTVLSCDEPATAWLSVQIIQQPVGGSGVNTVSCTFNGTAFDDEGHYIDGGIELKSEWHSPHGIYNEESFKWTMHDEYQSHTVSKSAPSGMYLDKPFWCELSWKDKDGTHRIVSDTAHCE
jgi:hypothetical protein